ncbi:DEAD/DEAH box helicase [Streptomyces iconiensis]|uniref:DEAD/DEAH box helicase n=1 Tax=Streptomyces iconiensis TaxID=1384038 RepID=A0ABT6ZTE7_9ACTN|nr:DEAD/DEAH box helicase [Streptomyces iconiensis]MDJ1131906.1 DEAD/DEAH box helicase [Streptomyces iconiensis]
MANEQHTRSASVSPRAEPNRSVPRGDPRDVLNRLTKGPDRAGRITHTEHLPPREGRHADWPDRIRPEVIDAVRAAGIERPWEHQARAAAHALEGDSVIIATGTASGKSLSYLVPVLSDVLDGSEAPNGRGSTALYLAPTKALAADQRRAVADLAGPLGTAVRPAVFDGDTPVEEREWVRLFANYVLTNPDMLHRGILPGHARWSSFLRALRYVVIDECHTYRGVFGSHVAQVLRRLRRLCARYGSDPVFLLASATAASPGEGAARLTGVRPVEITEDTSPRGETVFALWEPPLTEMEGERGAPVRRTATAEAAELLTDLAVQGVRTVAFVRSRRGAELVSLIAQDRLSAIPAPREPLPTGGGEGTADGAGAEEGVRGGADPAGSRGTRSIASIPGVGRGGGLSSRIAAYRGGYLPEERRTLERALHTGELLGLAATNALELGIDISGLDAVLITGYPGTRASLWQQAGRAGRKGQGALAILIARDEPLDTYLVHHPESIFETPVESTVLDPHNPYVLAPHLCAAAAEIPLTEGDFTLFGPETAALLEKLEQRKLLRRRGSAWHWTRKERAADLTDIRGSGGSPVQVVEEGTGRLLGTVDAAAAHTTVHEGAVHLHQGRTYVVRKLDLEDSAALVEESSPPWTTMARDTTALAILETEAEIPWGDARLCLGSVEVTNQVVSYLRRRLMTGEVLGESKLDLPPRTLRTRAVWWTVTEDQLDAARINPEILAGALHAAEHASIGILPLFATCDRWDIGGVSIAQHPDTLLPTVFVYDGQPGGAGFSERAFHTARAWLTATRDAIAACNCDAGCPSCVQSPKCGNANDPLHKAGAIRLLTELLKSAT